MASNAIDTYCRCYEEQTERLGGPDWVTTLRLEAMDGFRATGLPGPKHEQWRFTPLRELEATPFLPRLDETAPAANDAIPASMVEGPHVVLVNGRFSPTLSNLAGLPGGVIVCDIAEAISRHEKIIRPYLGQLARGPHLPLASLNTSFLRDGLFIHVPRHTEVPGILNVTHLSHPDGAQDALQPHNLYVIGESARLSMIERWQGDGRYLVNTVSEIAVSDNAHLGHYRQQAESLGAYHLSTIAARVCRDATYDNFTLTTGAKLARNEVHVALTGLNACSHLNGVYLLGGEQHTDTTTHTDHLVPHGSSNQTYKGVIADKAHAVFQGKIHVHPGAQKTDGYQLNQAILLSDTAQIDSKPELEIYADDVKCSHGATAGQLDTQALFYLRSRGIPEAEARALLIESFLAEAVELISEDNVQEAFLAIMRQRLREL